MAIPGVTHITHAVAKYRNIDRAMQPLSEWLSVYRSPSIGIIYTRMIIATIMMMMIITTTNIKKLKDIIKVSKGIDQYRWGGGCDTLDNIGIVANVRLPRFLSS